MTYEYQDPRTQGMVKVKLTKEAHEAVFRKKPYKSCRYEYYLGANRLDIHRFTAWWVILLNWLLFPISLITHGLANTKEIWQDHVKLLNEKKYGSFVSESVWSSSKIWDKIVEGVKI